MIDLDGDAVNEIMVSYRSQEAPGCVLKSGELIRGVGSGFVVGWTGTLKIDTTGPESQKPVAERDRSLREINFDKTIRSHGGMICFRKIVSMAGGVRFDPSKLVEECFPLASGPLL